MVRAVFAINAGKMIGAILLAIGVLFAYAQQVEAISSGSYQIREDFIGGGGGAGASSSSYRANDALGGAAGVGGASGTIFGSQTGSQTADEPALSFAVTTASVSLGSLSTSLTRTGTATFSVANYTSYGYIVQMIGSPPNNGTHPLSGMSSAASSSIGTEQFGINLVANTSPSTLGADPQQIPNGNFGFGSAASGYNTANQYKYVAGDTIASAPKSSGQTTFTISFIANIANDTPGGSYSGNQTLVVTGTY
ncbi:MAG TPA: hypothetical protein VLA88_03420 [Candidatus Saccharimonadales bacterium]|nr:hypothetical protein [Candidatus Saccharimonadales bacterium]